MFPITPEALSADIWIVAKVFFLVGLSLYNVFAFVIVRQVDQMTKTLEVGFEAPLKIFAFLHLFAALALTLLALMVL